MLVATNHVPYDVINVIRRKPLASEYYAESLNYIVFIDISGFTECFAFVFFYCFVGSRWPYRTKTVFILIKDKGTEKKYYL